MKKKRLLSVILLIAIFMSAFIFPVSAGVPPTDITFTVTSLKVTSSPIEEENDITIEAVYHASVTNHGWSSSVWHQCNGCGGAGAVKRYGGLGDGGKVKNVTLVCGQTFEGRTWMCRSACDGKDYYDQFGDKGTVTHNTENPWDNDSSNSWNDGGQHIWGSLPPIPCECTMKVNVSDEPANSGIIPCMGCGGVGNIYRGMADCSSCDSDDSNCKRCGGTGQVKVFDPCGECSGSGFVTEYIPCASCGGSGGSYVTVTHPPVEPVGQISTEVNIALEGKVLETQTITFDLKTTTSDSSVWTKEGDVTVVWTINTDEGIGEKDVTTDINKGEDTETIPIEVLPACNLTVQFVPPNSDYRTGTEVISTFVVQNHNDTLGLNVRPKHKLTADFTATSGSKVLATKKVTDIVIPKDKSNIVYFKWFVPEDTPVGEISVQCKINTGYKLNESGVNEKNYADNTAVGKNKVEKLELTETPDTQFEERAPSWFRPPATGDNVKTERFAKTIISNASFEQWEWANDWYKLASYNVKLNAQNKAVPDVNSPSHKLVDSTYQMRSGYGISSDVKLTITSNAPAVAVTKAQTATMHFPEYRYSSENSKFRTLDLTASNVFNFAKNENAKNDKGATNNRRIHFTPLYYPDGDYNIKSYVFDLWTPGGMLSTIASDSVTITGDMYDDWYISQTKPNR